MTNERRGSQQIEGVGGGSDDSGHHQGTGPEGQGLLGQGGLINVDHTGHIENYMWTIFR